MQKTKGDSSQSLQNGQPIRLSATLQNRKNDGHVCIFYSNQNRSNEFFSMLYKWWSVQSTGGGGARKFKQPSLTACHL